MCKEDQSFENRDLINSACSMKTFIITYFGKVDVLFDDNVLVFVFIELNKLNYYEQKHLNIHTYLLHP
jgi:hypothetical protein